MNLNELHIHVDDVSIPGKPVQVFLESNHTHFLEISFLVFWIWWFFPKDQGVFFKTFSWLMVPTGFPFVVPSLSRVWLFAAHELQPTRPLCPWDFPGKNTGVGCHFLLQKDLPDPRIELKSVVSPELAGGLSAKLHSRMCFKNCLIWSNHLPV